MEVFAKVAAAVPCRLLLVGDGPEMPAVRAAGRPRLGLADKVEFLGQVDNLEEILPVADLLLLPSLHESFGLVALEAMACGVMPLATNRGGAGEFIQDGINGFLRDPQDVDGHGRGRGPGAAGTTVCGRRWPKRPAGTPPAISAPPAWCKQYLDLYDRLLAGLTAIDATVVDRTPRSALK